MNKLFTKIAGLSIGLAMAIGVGVAVGNNGVKTLNAAAPYDFSGDTVTFSNQSLSNDTKYSGDFTNSDTFKVNFTGGTNDGKYYNTGTGIRTYGGGKINVAALNSKTLTKVVFTFSGSSYAAPTNNIDGYTLNNATGTWSGSASSISLTRASGSGHWRLQKVQATVSGGASTYTVTININNSDYGSVDKQSVTSITSGTSISASSNVLTVGNTTVTATAETSTPQFTYAFSSWSGIPAGGTVTGNITVTANFTKTANPVSSLAITGSMTKTTYTQGEAWDPIGFTVNAYYSSAPSTPVNVTSSVEWSYSPATTASTSTTSVTCTASFGGQTATSSDQSVVINEKTNLGGLVSGEKYFIIANGRYLGAFDSAPGAPAGTSKAWPGDESAPTSDDDAWLFTGTSTDDNWIITSKAGNTLYATSTNNGLGCTSSGSDNWTVHDTENGLKITASNGRYLTQYGQSNFRVYTSTTGQTEADSTVRFVKYVAPAAIESVEFTGDMTKKEYFVGDSWDYSGIKLQANKSDETSEDLGAISALITAGDLEIEASPSAPGTGVTSVTVSGIYGEDLLEAEITITGITVSTPRSITGVAITGDMTNKSYTAGDSWDYSGLNMTVTYDQGQPDVVALSTAVTAGDIEFTPNPATATTGTTSLTLGSITHISFEGEISDKVITGITVSAVPGRINFGTTSGYWNPTASGATTTDNLGSSVEITSNSGAAYTQQGSDWKQIGTNSNAATEIIITIDLTDRSGIDALSIKYEGAASRSNHTVLVYGDTTSDVILNGSVSGTTNHEQSTGQEYTKINADYIHVKFTGNVAECGGIKIFYIQYTLGSTVQEFGTLKTIEVDSSSQHETVFKLNQTFSSNGLILLATDTTGFTKLISEGFTTSKDGVELTTEAEDIEVVVTLTLKGVTKTCSYTIDVINPPVYTLASTLYEGQKVLIGATYSSTTYVAGALNGKYLDSVAATLDGSTIEFNEDALEFTVEFYGFNILLRSGSNYLKCNGDRDITFTPTLTDDCVWSFDGSSLTPVAHSGYEMRYNGGSPRFTTYSTGGQTAIGLYVSSATPKDAAMGAATFAQQYLHMRDYTDADGSCKNDSANHYYSTAKSFYTSASFSAEEKVEFAKLTDAVARLQAWARANGETFDPSAKTFSVSSGRVVFNAVVKNSSTTIIIIAISAVSLAAIGGYFLFRKKKED